MVTGVQLESTYKCEENVEEPVTTETEDSYQVSCFISQDVKYMHTALRKVIGPSYWDVPIENSPLARPSRIEMILSLNNTMTSHDITMTS